MTQLDRSLATRISEIGEAGLSCDLVINPSVGQHQNGEVWRNVAQFYLDNGLLGFHSLAVLSNSTADHAALSGWIAEARETGFSFPLDIIHESDLSIRLGGTTYSDVRWNVAVDRTVPSSYGLPLSGRPVVWSSDPFPQLERNSDYLGRQESVFTTRIGSYQSSGYIGLSDFVTIGQRFQEGGGPARAVAIHLTYQHEQTIRMRHFCSDSNQSTDDTGGKFLEALTKLVSFVQSSHLQTNAAVESFLDLHKRQHFPGLGKVKQISIENHLLVMDRAI